MKARRCARRGEDAPARGVQPTSERKASRAALASSGRSCCTQWPAPSTEVPPRKSGKDSAMASTAPGSMEATASSEPVRKPTGMV